MSWSLYLYPGNNEIVSYSDSFRTQAVQSLSGGRYGTYASHYLFSSLSNNGGPRMASQQDKRLVLPKGSYSLRLQSHYSQEKQHLWELQIAIILSVHLASFSINVLCTMWVVWEVSRQQNCWLQNVIYFILTVQIVFSLHSFLFCILYPSPSVPCFLSNSYFLVGAFSTPAKALRLIAVHSVASMQA